MGVQRFLDRDDQPQENGRPAAEDWLSLLETERETMIRRLRHIDQILIKHGRLRSETIPRRQR